MTVHELLHNPPSQAVLTVHFLLLAAQMALLFHVIRDGRSCRIRLSLVMHFLLGFGLFYLMMVSIFHEYAYFDTPDKYPPILSTFGSLPALTVIVYEILTGAGLLWAVFDLFRYRKNHPTFQSIKESLDLLPVGIAFERKDGSTALRNLVMDQLAEKAKGKDTRTVTRPEDSSVWQIASEEVTVEGETFTQLTATEITEQAAISRKLEERGVALRDIHMRLDIYNRQAERIIIARELLTARMAVHNELGSILLESRHYLNESSAINEEILLQALKNTNTYLLREYEQDDTARDALMDALEMAEAIGVKVKINGVLPAEDTPRGVLGAAITECATNAVKHANGDRLSVSIRSAGDRTEYTLQSNGQSPKTEIRESGGLLSLRTLVEDEHGEMRIESLPYLRLTILLPET